jgi:very-short-patch-repair endonuclease
LPPEVYLESTRVTHFNLEEQAEARELDVNLLEERRNTTLSNVRKYQMALKKYYNKSVVQRELNIGDLVLKKDIHIKDMYKFSTPWEVLFIIVDVAAPEAYVLAEVDGGMLPNTWNVDQLRKYYV